MDALSAALASGLQSAPPGALAVAFSGGGDSSALLHALAALEPARQRGLRVLHVDHGLHPESGAWAQRCKRTAESLGLPHSILQVEVEDRSEGLEAAARKARYAALAAAMQPGDVLVTAQHRDDQAETLLLRLLHGAGSEGLAGMRRLRRFGPGWLWRPLLDLPRSALHQYAERHGIDWIDDPANADPRYARSWLRGQLMPLLQQRWPDAGSRIAMAADRLRQESDLLLQQADAALARARSLDPKALRIEALLALPEALRRMVIGNWLDQACLPRPPAPLWSRIEPELLRARADAEPLLAWRGAELRRYRGLLYCMAPLAAVQTDWQIEWNGRHEISLPDGFGRLHLDPPADLDVHWLLRPRRCGERIRLHGNQRSDLRKRLQEIGLPPWQRERLPLLCSSIGEVLAAGDLLLACSLRQQLAEHGCRLCWRAD